MKSVKKAIKIGIIAFTMSLALTGCATIESLKGNGSSSEKEADKDELYENWNVDTTLSLNEKVASFKVNTNNKDLKIEVGKSKRKDMEYFSATGDNLKLEMYSKQGTYYLNVEENWFICDNLKNDDKAMIDTIKNALDLSLSDVKILKSQFKKEDSDTVDILELVVPDIATQKQLDKEKQEQSQVVDDGEFGNDIPVIIFEDEKQESSDNKKKDKNKDAAYDGVTMKIKVYVNNETEEIVKITYPINKSNITIDVSDFETKLPKKAEKGDSISSNEFVSFFNNVIQEMVQ